MGNDHHESCDCAKHGRRRGEFQRVSHGDWGRSTSKRILHHACEGFAIGPDSDVDAVVVESQANHESYRVSVGAPFVGRLEPPILITPAKFVNRIAASPYKHSLDLLCYHRLPAVLPPHRAIKRVDVFDFTFVGAGEESVLVVPIYGRAWGTLTFKNATGAALVWRVLGHVFKSEGTTELAGYEVSPGGSLAAGSKPLGIDSYTWENGKLDFIELVATKAAAEKITVELECGDR